MPSYAATTPPTAVDRHRDGGRPPAGIGRPESRRSIAAWLRDAEVGLVGHDDIDVLVRGRMLVEQVHGLDNPTQFTSRVLTPRFARHPQNREDDEDEPAD